jgi:hypothetical protein
MKTIRDNVNSYITSEIIRLFDGKPPVDISIDQCKATKAATDNLEKIKLELVKEEAGISNTRYRIVELGNEPEPEPEPEPAPLTEKERQVHLDRVRVWLTQLTSEPMINDGSGREQAIKGPIKSLKFRILILQCLLLMTRVMVDPEAQRLIDTYSPAYAASIWAYKLSQLEKEIQGAVVTRSLKTEAEWAETVRRSEETARGEKELDDDNDDDQREAPQTVAARPIQTIQVDSYGSLSSVEQDVDKDDAFERIVREMDEVSNTVPADRVDLQNKIIGALRELTNRNVPGTQEAVNVSEIPTLSLFFAGMEELTDELKARKDKISAADLIRSRSPAPVVRASAYGSYV